MTFNVKPALAQNVTESLYHDQYRPQEHFSPRAHWMNDPNGMVYFNHTYHLFFQYYPGATVWGPMHWGHAVSTDLVHWKQLPIALYPDSLGYIFSGSAVVDYNNTSGFSKDGKPPVVAIFTQHDPNGEKAGRNDFQNQSIAYSLDGGYSWKKYNGNPVLKNPGIRDFRDPKVSWYAAGKKWIMTLATKADITFYSSVDLKNWKKESEFGREIGAHGGVWECPDLFPFTLGGKTWWVLVVNLNPGGPNGGSATQYFIGQFDGHGFAANDTKTRWLDYGPDEYAGVTWGNTPGRRIFLGWMSNWNYATQVPTEKWRSAMTLPRELKLLKVNDDLLLTSEPVKELAALEEKPGVDIATLMKGNIIKNTSSRFVLKLNIEMLNDYSVVLSNDDQEKLIFGFDKTTSRYYIDRRQSGKTGFNPQFSGISYAPRLLKAANSDLTLVADDSSVEVFADKGLAVMTAIFFPGKPYNRLQLDFKDAKAVSGRLLPLKPIW